MPIGKIVLERVEMASVDIAAECLEKLKTLHPEIFTEGREIVTSCGHSGRRLGRIEKLGRYRVGN